MNDNTVILTRGIGVLGKEHMEVISELGCENSEESIFPVVLDLSKK